MTKTKHTAKRICKGEYEYRGYKISDMGTHWNLGPEDGFFTDATDSFRDSKAIIDEYYRQGIG